MLGLEPDLVVAWASGNGTDTVERLRDLGLKVFVSEPRRIGDIPATVERLGRLTGADKAAQSAARQFRRERDRLARRYANAPEVPVFFQDLAPADDHRQR
ncbi:MAG: hypothetical protein U5L11_16155 [Arhodomonas sp.]|nr:hypothetical protein [Arhodomonas sp.]